MPFDSLYSVLRTILRYAMRMLILPTFAKSVSNAPMQSSPILAAIQKRSLHDLEDEVVRSFTSPCTIKHMLAMSRAMQAQYEQKLKESEACMLPSFVHTLPNGQEKGTFVALDVGGSTFRVALVELHPRGYKKRASMTLHRMTTNKIDESVRRLPSTKFFDWMASKIQDMLKDIPQAQTSTDVIPLGLTWSFPIEQTSHRSGKMQGMGKGFYCSEDTAGKDLGSLLESACKLRGLSIRVDAIVNDSAATLLSQAYIDQSTSMGLILGTGTNAASYLPTSTVGRTKFGVREQSWFRRAEKVIINTEMSMFGKNVLPETIWDEILNESHKLPDFQPLEYMSTGRYLGELFRLVITEAVQTCNMFNGVMPEALLQPYTLDTAILARLESDESEDFVNSIGMIQTEFGLGVAPTCEEVAFLRTAAQAISQRASAYVAVALHAMWALQKDTEINPTTPAGTPKTSIACNGSVILKYPGFKDRCENYIAQMIFTGSAAGGLFIPERVVLEPADEAAVFGAAVAVALSDTT